MLQNALLSYIKGDFEVNLTKNIAGYRLNLRSAARAFWNGTFDWFMFYEATLASIQRAYTQAWYEGAEEAGILPSELTQEELNALQREILMEQGRVDNLASYIEANRKGTGKLGNVFQRIELWVRGYDRIKQLAISFATRDGKLMWQFGDAKHCTDCLNLNGRVYRASIWRKYNLHPKSWDLECHGIHCRCQFIPTDDPVTPGRPPNIAGST